MGSRTENKLRTRNKIKESIQEKHRIPVRIQNCVRIIMILTTGRNCPGGNEKEAGSSGDVRKRWVGFQRRLAAGAILGKPTCRVTGGRGGITQGVN